MFTIASANETTTFLDIEKFSHLNKWDTQRPVPTVPHSQSLCFAVPRKSVPHNVPHSQVKDASADIEKVYLK